jgi:tetratricopeptide (TPR) repeat protein
MGWVQCDAGPIAQFEGVCDPPDVNTALPATGQARAHVARALTLISLGRIPQARQSLDAAVKLDPRNLAAFKLRARSQIPGNATAAEADVNAGLALDPSDSDLLAMRALFLHARSDLRGAIREASLAIRNNPRNADALWIRAGIFLHTNDLNGAESDLTNALQIEPDYLRARQLRGEVRMRLNRYADALDDADRVAKQRPGDPFVLQLRATARAALGDLKGLVSDLTTVLGEPGQPINADPALAMFNGLYVQRAIALVRLGRHAEATQDIATVTLFGGQKAILRMQIYLRANGFPNVPITGKRSDLFDDAMKACFIDQACGRGIAERI